MSMVDALHGLHLRGALRDVDVAFAALLKRSGGSAGVRLGGALAMRAVSLGHSGFALSGINGLLFELGEDSIAIDLDAWEAELRESPLVAADCDAPAPLCLVDGRLSLRRYARYEDALARALVGRVQHDARQPLSAPAPDHWRRLFELHADAPLDRQALAAWLALRQRVSLITGGPGTGKTTTVARLFAAHLAEQPQARVALAAPTGRAAARLAEAITASVQRDVDAGRLAPPLAARIPREAQTLHRLLGWRSGKVGFRHHAGFPLPFDTVIVDEASMIDLPMMAKLVDAVSPDARLILLGDPDQLPAVEAGHVLGALCDAAGDGIGLPAMLASEATQTLQAEVALEASPHALSGHRVHLSRGYRQADAAALAALANGVRDGDAESTFARLAAADGTGVQWRSGPPSELETVLRHEFLPELQAIARAADPMQALQLASRVRVLTATRRGPFGASTWNAWFARQLGGSGTWFHGRLVMITANSYRHGLFNGDVGIAWEDDDGDVSIAFDVGGTLRRWRPSQLPQHDSAFASTVHKAQGSEFDRIALLLPDQDSRVLNRELLYTGLTRARREVLLWSNETALRRAIERRTRRDTGLRMRLQHHAGRVPEA